MKTRISKFKYLTICKIQIYIHSIRILKCIETLETLRRGRKLRGRRCRPGELCAVAANDPKNPSGCALFESRIFA